MVFTIDSLKQGSRVYGFLSLVYWFTTMVVASIVVGKQEFHAAFGDGVKSVAGTILFLSFLSLPISYCAYNGHMKHNKFVLMVSVVSSFPFMVIITCLSGALVAYSQNVYSTQFREDCMMSEPLLSSPETCHAYIREDFVYLRLHALWKSKFDSALEGFENVDDEEYLVNLQSGGECCGFGPPKQCIGTTLDKADCGIEALWYPARGCRQVSNPNVNPPIFGGCPYDMPMGGKCSNKEVDTDTKGCAYYLEQELSNSLASNGYLLLGTSFIHFFLGSFISLCFMGKRKVDDVLPECMLENRPHKMAILLKPQSNAEQSIVLTELQNIQTNDDGQIKSVTT